MNMHDAARNGDLGRVRQLIEAGVSVDSLDEDKRTPLHLASHFDQYEVAALLINSKCNINPKDRYGRTPVNWAAYYSPRSKDIVGLLLQSGAQVNCPDAHGYTLLHRASSEAGWKDIARLILENGKADINAVTEFGSTPLMWTTLNLNETEEVAALLIQAGADINRADVYKRTVLHWAVHFDSTKIIQVLLEKEGLDISPQNDMGDTPLHEACGMYRREVRKQLLEAGADINMKNNQGETALSIGITQDTLTIKEIRLFVHKGAFLENYDFMSESRKKNFKENILTDVELCTQSVVNKFNLQSLPALNSITYFASRLPNVDHFKLRARHIDDVEYLVKCEIERNTFCSVDKVHPIALSALCVLSLLTCQSGKKLAASIDFGHSH